MLKFTFSICRICGPILFPPVITWPEESSSVDLEQDMLRSVSQFLADRNDIYQASSASLLAGTIQAESKANIIAGVSGDPVLELKVDYNRAWVQIRQALQSANINIVDENRDQSFFSVRFAGIAEEQDEPGWFGRFSVAMVRSKKVKSRISASAC
jgi:outer membrane protein assembly factor BamC